jgi:hypothetical protein
MVQREGSMGHPFAVEFKRLAYEAVKRKSWQKWHRIRCVSPVLAGSRRGFCTDECPLLTQADIRKSVMDR